MHLLNVLLSGFLTLLLCLPWFLWSRVVAETMPKGLAKPASQISEMPGAASHTDLGEPELSHPC